MCINPIFFETEVPKHPNQRQNYFLDQASRTAKRSTMTQRHGCVIVKNNKIISTGFNKHAENFKKEFATIHAEIVAIQKAKRDFGDLSKCELYVVRIGTDNSISDLKMSKPCKNCSREIIKHNIKKIFFTTNYELEEAVKENRCIGYNIPATNSEKYFKTDSAVAF